MFALIIGCEVMFWVLLGAGLVARYRYGLQRTSVALLVAAPAVDLILLTATTIDLAAGAVASTGHVLAVVYLGVSVGFGHQMMKWADAQYAYRWGGGPKPPAKPSTARGRAAHERRAWLRHLVAWSVGGSLSLIAIWWVGVPARTEAFVQVMQLWTLILAIDFAWMLSYQGRARHSTS